MIKKNVLITGTSTGLGFETAILFANNGYKVYATMRNLKKADALNTKIETDNLDIEILPLDVTDVKSIHSAVSKIINQDGKIDILINNAGTNIPEHFTKVKTKNMVKFSISNFSIFILHNSFLYNQRQLVSFV